MFSLRTCAILLATAYLSAAHTVITYPGWRGDNLVTNGTVGVDDYKSDAFPYGMQWMYPCTLFPTSPFRPNTTRTPN